MGDLAKLAYEAYGVHQGWKNYQGNPMPPWEEVREDIQQAWGAAVGAVLDELGSTYT